MRDLLVAGIIFGSLPLIFYRPFVGIIVWTWISLMNPHRLAWGFAYDFPFAKIVGAVTIAAMLLSMRRMRLPLTRETLVLLFLILWMLLTTVLALEPSLAWEQWDKVIKIQIIVFATMVIIRNRQQVNLFIWMIVLSIGFYGVKGGIFTLWRGGVSHVLGPPGSFIADNNHLGLALAMVIPLMRFLQLTHSQRWVKIGLGAAMALTGIATLGTQSRGAFLGVAAMTAFLVLKSRRRLAFAAAAVIVIPIALVAMPQSWYERMDTIGDYQSDRSAMGRINSWGFAARLAVDRPLVGGGFEVFTPRWFAVYAPDPSDFHDAHSIYFEILGEHGFVGLFLFLTLALLTWRTCTSLIRAGQEDDESAWLADLGRMCQVSLFAFAVAGSFVGLAYFDFYYNVVAIVVIAKLLLVEHRRASREEELVETAHPRWETRSLANHRI